MASLDSGNCGSWQFIVNCGGARGLYFRQSGRYFRQKSDLRFRSNYIDYRRNRFGIFTGYYPAYNMEGYFRFRHRRRLSYKRDNNERIFEQKRQGKISIYGFFPSGNRINSRTYGGHSHFNAGSSARYSMENTAWIRRHTCRKRDIFKKED